LFHQRDFFGIACADHASQNTYLPPHVKIGLAGAEGVDVSTLEDYKSFKRIDNEGWKHCNNRDIGLHRSSYAAN
jgi:hypothetical protein